MPLMWTWGCGLRVLSVMGALVTYAEDEVGCVVSKGPRTVLWLAFNWPSVCMCMCMHMHMCNVHVSVRVHFV